MQDVVLFNQTDDDGFMECTGREIVFENMTFLQLGGYDGIVQVGQGSKVAGPYPFTGSDMRTPVSLLMTIPHMPIAQT